MPMVTWTPQLVLIRCWPNLILLSCYTVLRAHPECVLSTCHSVVVISYSRRTQHHSHRRHCGPQSHRRSLSGWKRFHREEGSFALLKCCPDPGCVHNASGTLRLLSNKGSRFDCYCRLIVVKHGVQIVVAPRVITCCNQPVEKIDWLIESKSKMTHTLYSSCQPKPTATWWCTLQRHGQTHMML
jgi:hypothetical protein